MFSLASRAFMQRTIMASITPGRLMDRYSHFSTALTFGNSNLRAAEKMKSSSFSWMQTISMRGEGIRMLENTPSVRHMSSTLKKRNKKMNKHKLRKRRKKLRRKSKK
jgi:hypothetical protein